MFVDPVEYFWNKFWKFHYDGNGDKSKRRKLRIMKNSSFVVLCFKASIFCCMFCLNDPSLL